MTWMKNQMVRIFTSEIIFHYTHDTRERDNYLVALRWIVFFYEDLFNYLVN